MTDLKVCRICLVQNVKMYKHVKEYYEEIINATINDTDGVPQWFCYECASILQKFYNFKQKCYRGLLVLKDLLKKGSISTDCVCQIDRPTRNLDSRFQLTSNSNFRVKTYVFKYKKVTLIDSHQKSHDLKENMERNKRGIGSKRLSKPKNNYFNKINKTTEFEKNYTNYTIGDDNIRNYENDICNGDNQSGVALTGTINHSITAGNINSLVNGNDRLNRESMKTIQTDKIIEVDKFKRSMKKKFLNPNHWKKISLTDEAADKEFKSKKDNSAYLKSKFKCSDCFRTFSQEEMLCRHMKIKHCKSLGPFECRFCHIRVKWKSRLQKHLKEHYTRYKCLRCELCFSVEETAFKHDEFHNGVIRTCPHCGEQFKHSSSFYTHLRKHRSKHICTICGISFLSEFGLYMHKKVKHILTNTEAFKTEENMFCQVCDIQFETEGAYDEHLAQSAMHTHVTGEEDCTPQPLKRKYTQRRAPRKYTKCSTCGQNFSTYVAYSKHHLAEHPNVPLVLSTHRPSIKKICEICGVSVAPVSLASHINTHTREKHHTCNICGTQLSTKSGLNRHQLTHTREKPNRCNLCDKSFAQTTNMKLHYRTVHLKESAM